MVTRKFFTRLWLEAKLMTACGFIFFKCAPTGVEGRCLNCAPVWLGLGCCERDVVAMWLFGGGWLELHWWLMVKRIFRMECGGAEMDGSSGTAAC
jgi:hypothetical protein